MNLQTNVVISIRYSEFKQLITVLKVSRVHEIFPKPRTIVICRVSNRNVKYIRCNWNGNRYQSHRWNSSLNRQNSLHIIWLNSQYKAIMANDQANSVNGVIKSIRFETSSDFDSLSFGKESEANKWIINSI